PIVLSLMGDFNTNTVEKSLAIIVDRHEALRTKFFDTADGPVQKISPESQFSVEYFECRDRAEAFKQANRFTDHIFDLSKEHPLKVAIFILPDDEYWLVINIHHIVCDAWSVAVLLEDFAVCYSSLVVN